MKKVGAKVDCHQRRVYHRKTYSVDELKQRLTYVMRSRTVNF